MSLAAPHIAGQLTDDQLVEFKEAFSYFDKDRDGAVSTKELGTLMRALGQNPSDMQLRDMINEVDADGNGTVRFKEFLTLMKRMMNDDKFDDDLREAFKIFDRDGNDVVNTAEMLHVVTNIGDKLTDVEVEDMISELDEKGEGQLSFTELLDLMLAKPS